MPRPRGFILDYKPQRKSRDTLDKVKVIIGDYAMPLTIRQIFYRLVGAYGYPKTENAYKNLGELLGRARRARVIEMEAIRDDGFTSHTPFSFSGIDHFLTSVQAWARDFRLDRQRDQPRRLVVMCEASGMAPQLYQITAEYGIPVLSAGGFDSLTDKHRLAAEWSALEQPTTVLRVGDYDPSGESMFAVLGEDIPAFAAEYGGDVAFAQIAITAEQARSRNLPSAPPKPKDHRPAHFNDTETWQAEALDPNDLTAILRQAIEARLDHAVYQAVLDEEAAIRQELLSRF
jgi:hypothetical protein